MYNKLQIKKKKKTFRHFEHKIQKKKLAYLLTLFPPLHLFAMHSLIASTYVSDSIMLSEETEDKISFSSGMVDWFLK